MKVFLLINFVMSLVLMSCDADLMSPQSSDDESKPIDIVGFYKTVDEIYRVKITKDDSKSSGYLLFFDGTGGELKEIGIDKYIDDGNKKLFAFAIKIDREFIDCILLFEKEEYPILTVGSDNPLKLYPYSEALF